MSELLADTKAARKRRKAIALTLVAVTLLLLIVAILWWRSLPAEDGTIAANSAAPIEMTAVDILAAHEDDPTLARLSNRPILINANLAAAPTTGTVILLDTPDPLADLRAEVDPRDAPKLSGVQAGAELSMRCERVAPGLRDPILQGCTLL